MYYSFQNSTQGPHNDLRNGVNLHRRNAKREPFVRQPVNEDKIDKIDQKKFIIDFILFVLETSNIHGLCHLSKRNLHFLE